MELEGRIIKVMDTQSFDSGFSKREFVVNTFKENYPQDIKFEVYKEKCEALNAFQAGDEVKVEFNIRGNEYNGRYYVNLQAWKIEKSTGQAQDAQMPNFENIQKASPSLSDAPAEPDDLPF